MGHFERKFQTEGASPANHCWCQKTRVTALSCGIKISAVHCLVLSQSTRVTDRQTDRRAGRENYDSQDRASIAAQAVKSQPTASTFSIYKIITYSVLIIPSTGRNSCNSTLHEFLLVNSAIAVTLNVGSKLTKLIHTQCRTSDEV